MNIPASKKLIFGDVSFRFAVLFHFACAVILFSPFFISGKFLIVSTDNYYYILPNLVFGLRDFQSGQFFPWNPYLLGGIDFSSSNYSFIYSPVYWLIYIFPEKYFFTAFTIVNFTMAWLVGVFAFLLFKEEVKDARWAFFASVTYQLCEQFFFSLNTYPYFVGWFLSTVIIYLIWTMHRRPVWASYLFMTFSFVALYTSCHIIRSSTLSVVIGILFLYRHWPGSINIFRPSRESATFYFSVITSLLISSIRLFPLIMSSQGSDRLISGDFDVYSNIPPLAIAYNMLHSFVPEFFGVTIFFESVPWQYSNYVTNLTYYGIIPALLAVYAMIRSKGRPTFWTFFLLGALCFQLWIKPISDIPLFLLYPYLHAFMFKIAPPIAFCFLVAHGGKHLEADLKDKDHLWWVSVMVGLVSIFAVLMFAMKYNQNIMTAKVAIITLLALTVFGAQSNLKYKEAFCIGFTGFLSFLSIVGLPILFFYMKSCCGASFWVSSLNIGATLIATSLLWLLLILAPRMKLNQITIQRIAICIVFAALIYILIPSRNMGAYPSMQGNAILSLLSLFKFVMIAMFAATMMIYAKRKNMAPFLFSFLLIITLFDLFPYNKVNSNYITKAFWGENEVQYPSTLIENFKKIIDTPNQKIESENLATNGSFESWKDNLPLNWLAGGQSTDIKISFGDNKIYGKAAVAVKTSAKADNIYHDVPVTQIIRKGDLLSFGAWIKTDNAQTVRLMLTDRLNNSWSDFHSGSGEWEWLSTTVGVMDDSYPFRAHVWSESESMFYVDDVIIVKGKYAPPFYAYKSLALPEKILAKTRKIRFKESGSAELFVDPLDLKKFRLPQPSAFFKLGGKYHYTHLPYLYNVRSFGGVNGFRSPYFLDLYRFFETKEDRKAGPGGQYEYLNSSRFLDLMGCGYDLANGKIIRRPGALSRFMLFPSFKIIDDDKAALEYLKSSDFTPRQKVLLPSDPGISSSSANRPGRDLDFDIINSNKIVLKVESDEDAMLFFNDSYDIGWKAYVNGEERPIFRADYNFMATTVPAGKSEIVFTFHPSDYLTRLLLVSIGLMLYLAGVVFAFRFRRSPNFQSA